MIAAASRRRAAAAFVLAWCVVAAALAVDAPRPAQAEDPPAPHADNLGDDGLTAGNRRCDIESPPSHSSGGACYDPTHGSHRRLDHYQKQQKGRFGWADTDQTTVMSCPRHCGGSVGVGSRDGGVENVQTARRARRPRHFPVEVCEDRVPGFGS